MPEWFESFIEGLWLPADEGREQEAQIIRRLLGLRKGQGVLDAPCGRGAVAIHLARWGLHVTGVDRNARFIRQARRKFRSESLPGEFRVLDLRNLDYEGQFHAAYNWRGSFGYFSDAEDADVVRRLARALRPGGKLLVDEPNREYILRHFRRRMVRGNVISRPRWHRETQRIQAVWTIKEGGRCRTCRSVMRLYTPGQFRSLFRQAGLTATFYGDWDGSEYRRGSRRMTVVGRKK
jgi:SAM-dependent methyltransferase